MNIGEAFRTLRKAKGLTQKQVAERAGISNNAVSLIEKNETMPHKETIKKLSDALGVPTSYWLFFAIDREDVGEDKRVVFDQLHGMFKDFLKSNL